MRPYWIRGSGWPPKSITVALYKKKDLTTETCSGRRPCEDEAEAGVTSHKPTGPGTTSLGRGMDSLSLGDHEKDVPLGSLTSCFQTRSLQVSERTGVCLFKPAGLWRSVRTAPGRPPGAPGPGRVPDAMRCTRNE